MPSPGDCLATGPRGRLGALQVPANPTIVLGPGRSPDSICPATQLAPGSPRAGLPPSADLTAGTGGEGRQRGSQKPRRGAAVRSAAPPERSDDRRPPGACSCITHPPNSHLYQESPHVTHPGGWDRTSWLAAPDWLDFAGTVEWDRDPEHLEQRNRLERARTDAQKARKAQRLTFPGFTAYVSGKGNAGGNERDSYCRFSLGIGLPTAKSHALTVHLDLREADDRQLYNFRCTMSGTCWATYGDDAFAIVHWLLENVGGTVTDSWVRRVDYCLDMIGVPFAPVARAYERQCYTSASLKRGGVAWEGGRPTGFTVGKGGDLSTTLYDKAHEMKGKPPAYQHGLLERWGCRPDVIHDLPEEAFEDCGRDYYAVVRPRDVTRLEYRVTRPYLKRYGIDTVRQLRQHEPEVVAKLGGFGDDRRRPPFRLTDRPVDRANGNQSRAASSALWLDVQWAWEHQFGRPLGRLTPAPRNMIEPDKLRSRNESGLLSSAAYEGTVIETRRELAEFAYAWVMKGTDPDIKLSERWDDHAMRAGTLDAILSFDPTKLDGAPRRSRTEAGGGQTVLTLDELPF